MSGVNVTGEIKVAIERLREAIAENGSSRATNAMPKSQAFTE